MTAPRSRRTVWLGIALVASLAVNAFLIGATATDLVHMRWPFSPKQPFRFELRWLEGHLPAEGIAKVEEAIAAAKPETTKHFNRLRALRRELAQLVAAPAPDRAAIDAKFVEIRAEVTAMQTRVQSASTEALLSLPPEMRAKLAEKPDGDQ
jgi:uncharacterized membrane protein